ncbi:MAG: glycoside hydrolase family 38 C-terminal domain-containing protein [Sulfolobales archaeon]
MSLRSLSGIRTKLFYIDAASTIRFLKVGLEPCSDNSSEYCGVLEFSDGDGFLFVDIEGEGTLTINKDLVHAIFRTPDSSHDNRFIPLPPGRNFIRISPSMEGPFGERLLSIRGAYLYVKEPVSFRFVVRASLLTDLAEYTGDLSLLEVLNKALDMIDVRGVSEEQLEAVSTYSVVKPPFYIKWKKYYDIRLDPDVKPLNPHDLSEMARKAHEVLDRELDRIVREVSGPEGVLHAVAHAHIDVSWLWTPDVSRKKLVRTLGNVLSLARSYEMRFALSNSLYLKWLREEDPELYRRVLDAVREGVIIPVGGMWVESDTNVIGGESLVRQFLYGQRFLMEEIGRITEIGWLPDSFGYTGSMPQILRKSGIKIFFIHKLYWNKMNRFPYSVFLWEGIDGSQIITVNYATYGSDLSPKQIVQAWRDHTSPEAPAFIAFGFGDGGGGPTWIMMERIKTYSRVPGAPRIILSDPYKYYESIKNVKLPVWRGELYLETHRGTYSTGSKIKRYIRLIEESLKDLEVISFIRGKCVNYKDLWLELLEAEFHDIASATLIREAYDHYIARLENLLRRINDEIRRISKEIILREGGVTVFNTLPWEREDVVPGRIRGSIQQIIDGVVYSLVKVPPLGFKSFEEGEGSHAEDLYADESRIRNNMIEVSADGRVRDLVSEIDLVKRSYIIACEDIPAEWDGWDIDPWYKRVCTELKPRSSKISERGPLRACLDIEYSYEDSSFTEKICVWRHSRRVDMILRGFIRERLTLFRKLFELGFEPTDARAEIPYGVIRRSIRAENPWEDAKFEFPVWRWLDVYSSAYGLAIFNKGRAGHSIDGGVVGLTLFKTPLFPNPHLDMGYVEVEYSIYPHEGDWMRAEIPRRALEYHRPLIASRGFSGERSLLKIDKPNILLETIKCAENARGFIARMWESYGGETVLDIEGVETDLIEMHENRVRKLYFKPFEIKSVMIRI